VSFLTRRCRSSCRSAAEVCNSSGTAGMPHPGKIICSCFHFLKPILNFQQ
jgi:hypothetical protein